MTRLFCLFIDHMFPYWEMIANSKSNLPTYYTCYHALTHNVCSLLLSMNRTLWLKTWARLYSILVFNRAKDASCHNISRRLNTANQNCILHDSTRLAMSRNIYVMTLVSPCWSFGRTHLYTRRWFGNRTRLSKQAESPKCANKLTSDMNCQHERP